MLDGFQYVLAQIGVVVAITALLAGLLGWLIGRGSRRRTEKSFERAIAAIARTEPEASAFAPPSVPETAVVPEDPAPETDPAPPAVADAEPAAAEEPLAQRQPYVATVIEHVPLHEVADPDATIIRPASTPKTTPYLPPGSVITSAPVGPGAAPYRPPTSVQPATAEDVQQLRQELRNRDLEIGRIEAGALSAWDRTVPQLERQIDDLLAENDTLRRTIREAEEHSDVDAATVEHLRALVAERDTRIAELRAQA